MLELFDQFNDTLAETGPINLTELAPAETIKSAEQIRFEWQQQRWGKFTASEFHKLMTYEERDDLPKGAATYAKQKAVELLTECKPDTYVSPAMQWGIDHEHDAIDAFMATTGLEVNDSKDNQVFLTLGDSVGGTPDGLIKSMGAGIEIKCPNSATHLDYMDTVTDAMSLKATAPEYDWQCQGLMMITGFESWFFVSYDPRYLNESLRLHIATIERDEADIAKLRQRLDMAIEYRDRIVAKRTGNANQAAVRKAIARQEATQVVLKAQLAELMQRVMLLEEAKEKRTRKPRESREPQKPEIPQQTPEATPPADEPDDDFNIEDAEGLASHVDYPDETVDEKTGEIHAPGVSIMPSQEYYNWLSIIQGIHTLSDIGRVAHQLKTSDMPKPEVDELLKRLVHRQQTIKNG